MVRLPLKTSLLQLLVLTVIGPAALASDNPRSVGHIDNSTNVVGGKSSGEKLKTGSQLPIFKIYKSAREDPAQEEPQLPLQHQHAMQDLAQQHQLQDKRWQKSMQDLVHKHQRDDLRQRHEQQKESNTLRQQQDMENLALEHEIHDLVQDHQLQDVQQNAQSSEPATTATSTASTSTATTTSGTATTATATITATTTAAATAATPTATPTATATATTTAAATTNDGNNVVFGVISPSLDKAGSAHTPGSLAANENIKQETKRHGPRLLNKAKHRTFLGSIEK